MAESMTGSLKQRSPGSWSVVIYLGKDPVTAKKRYKWHTVEGNKKKAQAELTRLLRELQTGTYVEPAKLTVGEYLQKWLLDYAKIKVSAKTYERYDGIIRNHLIPEFGSMPLPKLQPLHVQSAYTRWLQDGRQDGRKGGLSARTVLHHHRVLSEALKQAVRWQLVARNIADAVEPPRPEYREMQAVEETESVWLLEAAQGTRLHVPILLAITTGMRRGEILALRWKDVNLHTGSVTVRRALQETKDGLHFKETKSRRARAVSLPSMALELLSAHRAKQEEYRVVLKTDYHEEDLVCCRENGSVWPPSAFTSAYRDLLKRRKLRNVPFHSLRHSHASQLLRAGVSPKVISERLGHSKVGFTLEVYSHLLPGMQEEAAAKLDQTLRSAMQQRRPC
jgi:integrase